MLFAFKAKDASGEIRSGSLEGATPNDVARLLTSRGLEPLEIKPASGGTASGRLNVPPAAPLPPPPALVPELAPPSRLAGPPSMGAKLTPPPVWNEPATQSAPGPQAVPAPLESAPPTRVMEAAPPTRPVPPEPVKRVSAQAELEKALAGGASTPSGRLSSSSGEARPSERRATERRSEPRPMPSGLTPASAPPAPSLLERIHWQRALGALGVLALLLVVGLGAARFFYREKPFQVVITGKVEMFGESLGASAPSRLNTKVYVYFPELRRALRPDGNQFELEGGKLIAGQSNWTAVRDPASAYELRWNKDTFELRATISARTPPTTCRVTVRKLGYARVRAPEFPLRATSTGVLTGVAPPVSMTPSTKRTRTPSSSQSGHGEGMEPGAMEDAP